MGEIVVNGHRLPRHIEEAIGRGSWHTPPRNVWERLFRMTRPNPVLT